ncbi:uncharacterized protein Dsimw501_GD28766 [Drosophila simulans]|uniref:Uncharacterized protein n=1 Tax=Drosophila simulans TaxID=7240 RepID=A0A0J9RAJ1_DROSI|nr:uncharacterized protein Dsimw501_GD28766 [Drosophila simulans]
MDPYGLTTDFQSIFKHVKAEVERRSTKVRNKFLLRSRTTSMNPFILEIMFKTLNELYIKVFL